MPFTASPLNKSSRDEVHQPLDPFCCVLKAWRITRVLGLCSLRQGLQDRTQSRVIVFQSSRHVGQLPPGWLKGWDRVERRLRPQCLFLLDRLDRFCQEFKGSLDKG